jgi:hypothetical protein
VQRRRSAPRPARSMWGYFGDYNVGCCMHAGRPTNHSKQKGKCSNSKYIRPSRATTYACRTSTFAGRMGSFCLRRGSGRKSRRRWTSTCTC